MTVIEKQYMDSVISINRMMRKAQDSEPDLKIHSFTVSREDDVKDAVEEADLLIAELKKTQEKK